MKTTHFSLRCFLSGLLLMTLLTLTASVTARTNFFLTSSISNATHSNATRSNATRDSLRPATDPVRKHLSETFGKLPLSFEPNQGQHASDIRFLSQGGNYKFSLHSAGATLDLGEASIKVTFKGANPHPQIEGLDELPGKTNYLTGNDQSQWHTGIPNFARVRYRNLWPGIDLLWYGQQQQLEYDFIVAPGADPNAIKLEFEGVEKLRVDQHGDLLLKTLTGEIRQRRPVVYQESRQGRRLLKGSYAVSRKRQAYFRVPKYNRSQPLIIDPQVAFIASLPTANDLAVDSKGNVYLIGDQNSTTAFVMKLNAAGDTILYNTIIQGNNNNFGGGIAVDQNDRVHFYLNTYATNLPVTNGSRSNNGTYKSTDGGQTWVNQGIYSEIVTDQTNPQVLYARVSGTRSRSQDGGQTWTAINQSYTPFAAVGGLTVYARDTTGLSLFKSLDGGANFAAFGPGNHKFSSLTIDPR